MKTARLLATLLLTAAVARAGLVAHWKLDEASGTTATDSSPNGNDGEWQGTSGTVGWQPTGGVAGGAVQFTGANKDTFIKEGFANITALPLTISCWVRTTSTANMGLACVSTGGGSSYYILREQGGLGKANARNATEVSAQWGTAINDGNWHHLVGVYTSDVQRQLYVDGVLRGTNTTSVPEFVPTRLGIGGLTRNTPYNPADLFTGMLDDVQVYDAALAPADVTFLFQNPGSYVGQPPVNPSIPAFAASVPEIYAGESTTLSWQATNATSVSIDGGIGSVDLTGTRTISPAATTTYTITASNAASTVTRSVTVTVMPQPAPPRAVIHWALDEGTGETVANSLGSSHGGSFLSPTSPVWETPGHLGSGALGFANEVTAVRSTSAPVESYPFSMSVWMRTTSTENDTVAVLASLNNSRYHSLRVNGGFPAITSRYDAASDTNGPVRVDDGQWHLLTGVWESRYVRRLYVDGAAAATSPSTAVTWETPDHWSLGSLDRPSGPVDVFSGSIDDPALFTGRLSADDVRILHGAMTGLAVTHGQADALRVARFATPPARAAAAGAAWEPVSGLPGAIGAVSGSLAGGDAAVVMTATGEGMRIQPDAPPVVVSFSSDAGAVAQGFPVTLSWQVFGATTVSISPGVGTVAASGTATVGAATSFTLTATNSHGTTTQTINLGVSPTPVHPSIVEFLAVNDGALRDNDGDASDWIELENRSQWTLSTAGYFLTDNPLTPSKWPLPTLVMPPGARLLVWASNKNANLGGQWHTNFTLDGDGEYLALTRSGTPVQEFAPLFPPQQKNVSYGLPAGSTTAAYLSPATPDAENPATGFGGTLKKEVVFSIPGGVRTTPVTGLALTHPDPTVTIRYTLDRTAPTASSPAYTAPLSLTGSTVVTAQAFREGDLPGPLEQVAYIVADASVASFTSTLPVLVIDSHGTALLDDGSNEARASIAIFEPVAGTTSLASTPTFSGIAGLHTRGQTTSGYPKKPYDLELRDAAGNDLDAPLLGFPAEADWVLDAQWNDRALLRTSLAQHLWEDMGYYNLRGKPVEVYFNTRGGSVLASDYIGIYWLGEDLERGGNRVDIKKLEAYQTTEPAVTGGYIFSADKTDPGDLIINGGDGNFIVREPDPARIRPAQTAWLSAHLNAFNTALNGANWLDPSLGYEPYIDRTEWVDYHILREFAKEVDSFVFSCHYHKDRSGPLMMGPQWDFDRAWGNSTQTLLSFNAMTNPQQWVCAPSLDASPGASGTRGRFWTKLFQDPDFMQLWIDRWQLHMDGVLSEASVHALVDQLAAANGIDPVARNFSRWNNLATPVGASPYSFANYAAAVAQVKSFVTARLAWVQSKFTARPKFGTAPGTFNVSLNLTLTGPAGAAIYYTLDGSDPRASGGSPAGTLYTGSIPLTASTLVRARALVGGAWSGLREGAFTPALLASSANLRITEINYHPAPLTPAETQAGITDAERFEFIEFLNTANASVDLSGATFTVGLAYTFPTPTLVPPGGRLVLARDPAALAVRYPDASHPALSTKTVGPFTGGLDNGGERLVLSAPGGSGVAIADLTYDDAPPWPAAADGSGATLVFTSTAYDAASALAHLLPLGNPGGPDTGYALWAQANGASASGSADTDSDGFADLVEYVLGSDPATPGLGSRAPVAAVATLPEGVFLTLTYTQAPGTDDVLVTAQSSPNLQSWAADPVLVSQTPNPDGSVTRVVRSPDPLSSQPGRHLRLRIAR